VGGEHFGECAMSDKTEQVGEIYKVSVRSILDEGWVRALDVEPVATHRHYSGPPRTVLTIRLMDQSALLNLLYRLHNMSLTVLSVELIVPRSSSEASLIRGYDF
jgi:hypothetical protein